LVVFGWDTDDLSVKDIFSKSHTNTAAIHCVYPVIHGRFRSPVI
jgi:hypothetical protein